MGGVRRHEQQRRCRGRCGDAGERSHASAEGAPPERHRRCCASSPHDGHEPDDLLPALLGHRILGQTRNGVQGGIERIGEETMKTVLTATAMISLTGLAVALLADAVNFDNLPVGRAPAGWTATKTGTGNPIWTVEKDATAPSQPNVLKQSGQATYPVCIKDDTNLKDGFVEVKFKPISGREDQAGGVVWRAKDPNNYYVARANALENNVTIFLIDDARPTEKK